MNAVLSLEDVLNQNPDLSYCGIRSPGYPSTDEEFDQLRQELAEDAFGEVAAALRFLDGVETIKAPTPCRTSYGLKHSAESHQYGYISNGSMIAALLMAGVPVIRVRGSPNVRFCISKRWLKDRMRELDSRRGDRYSPPEGWTQHRPGIGIPYPQCNDVF